MKRLIIAVSLILGISTASAQETVREISWSEHEKQDASSVGKIIEADSITSFAQLKVENSEDKPRTFAILSVSDPGITTLRYALTGKVRYENVEGTGYLEMWNHFPDGSMYFSRTLGGSGPMQSLQGSSDWRPFTLPFYIGETTDMRPIKLEFNVVLPGRGTIYLSSLKLVQYKKKEKQKDVTATAKDNSVSSTKKKGWWSSRMAGLLGGITGSVIGCIGALIGTLAGLCKARKVVFSLLAGLLVFGVGCLILGLVAVILAQPYSVYYGPLITGFLCTILPLVLYREIRKRYEEKELRKIKSMDIS